MRVWHRWFGLTLVFALAGCASKANSPAELDARIARDARVEAAGDQGKEWDQAVEDLGKVYQLGASGKAAIQRGLSSPDVDIFKACAYTLASNHDRAAVLVLMHDATGPSGERSRYAAFMLGTFSFRFTGPGVLRMF